MGDAQPLNEQVMSRAGTCFWPCVIVGQGPVSVVSFSGEKRTGNNKTTCYAGGEVSFSLPVKNLPRYNNVGLPATLMYLGGVHGQ